MEISIGLHGLYIIDLPPKLTENHISFRQVSQWIYLPFLGAIAEKEVGGLI
jgi:hypothetical protein